MARKRELRPLLPHYSLGQGKEFWKVVNSIRDEHAQSTAYILGCVMQDLEKGVLNTVNFYAENRLFR